MLLKDRSSFDNVKGLKFSVHLKQKPGRAAPSPELCLKDQC